MLLIYSSATTSRLQYSCYFILKQLLGLDYSFTIDSVAFENYPGIKINYSPQQFKTTAFNINPAHLLFEDTIKAQSIECFTSNGYKAFFKIANSHFLFDIFAASFYLLSRYEEYLPHTKDMYGRYAHQNSLSFKENFLHLPLINIWVNDFAMALENKFSDVKLQRPEFKYIPTYDIDMAYGYKHKGLLRNIGGFLKNPSLERIKVLLGLQQDPFDAYKWLNNLHHQNNLKPLYFFLVAQKNGQYDKNILPHKNIMWQLINHHAQKYTVGLHPSWQSGDNKFLLQKEIEQLKAMMGAADSNIAHSRQHYIRFNLPEDYEHLIKANITDDYSMGYGSINGFRASVASTFYWYNLKTEKQTTLQIHPFCYMEANSFYEQHFTAAQAYEEMQHYYKICKKVGGTLITIWHNNFLGTAKEFVEWKKNYEKFISEGG